jgi:pyruvate kinase
MEGKREATVNQRKTRIVCTIGPASSSPALLARLVHAGMDVARLNLAHGDRERHLRWSRDLRAAADRAGRPVALLCDLGGPRIRTGELAAGPVELRAGERWTVTPGPVPTRPGLISVNYPAIARDLGPGGRILLADGTIELVVAARRGRDLLCRVVAGGALGARKGVNLPGVPTRLPSLTRKDLLDLDLAIAIGADYLALSFVRSAADLNALSRALRARGARIPILAKIEKPQALADLPAILDACDGVMVARGDLGVELSPEKVPLAQKMIIAAANRAGKPVITATQMLESMTQSPRPTRAEASDVANAILDGTDAVMLSEETSVGRYPVEALRMMGLIALEAESALPAGPLLRRAVDHRSTGIPDALAGAACLAAQTLGLAAIVAFTRTGGTAALAAQNRPAVPVIAVTHDPAVQRRMALHRGVVSLLLPERDDIDAMIAEAERALLRRRLLRGGETIAILSGLPLHVAGRTNMLKLHVAGKSRGPGGRRG